MPPPDHSDEDIPIPAIPIGTSPAPPGLAPRTLMELQMQRQINDMMNMFGGMQVQMEELQGARARREETTAQPTNINAAIDKERYAKDDDVKHLSIS